MDHIKETPFEDDYLKKIISQQTDLFFQFTVSPNYSISIDYLSGVVYDFCELTLEEIKLNPKIILTNRICSEDLNKFKESIRKCFHSLGRWELDYRINLPVNGVKWIKVSARTERLENGNVIFFGTNTDVTGIKHLEEDYKISEARYQFANLASEIGVWDWNMVTNEVFYSAQSLKILELDNNNNATDLIGNPEKWDDMVHPDDLEIYFGNIKDHFEEKTPFYETCHRVLCNESYKWILDRGKVISRDSNGKPLRIIGTHTDVSVQKVKEQKLQETLDLVNNQKNRLLNFAHIVSHNLRKHTGNLSSLLEMEKEGMLEKEEILPNLRIVSKELSTTIDNLVELVNVQNNLNINKEELNVNYFLNKIFHILANDISENNISIVNKIPDAFTVNFMPAYLESILLNLTTNAIKYSNPSVNSLVEYYIEEKEGFKIVCVKDNGLGIDLDRHKESVFGLYKTFHHHEDSTGIGLHITKNQIEAMDGKIEVESIVNEGSIFKIFFK